MKIKFADVRKMRVTPFRNGTDRASVNQEKRVGCVLLRHLKEWSISAVSDNSANLRLFGLILDILVIRLTNN